MTSKSRDEMKNYTTLDYVLVYIIIQYITVSY